MKCEKLTNVEPRKLGFSMEVSCNSPSHIIAYGDNIDELVDSVISFNNIKFISGFVDNFVQFLSNSNLKKLEEKIIKLSRAENLSHNLIYFSSKIAKKGKVEDYDFSMIENHVLSFNSKYDIACLAAYASKEFFYKAQNIVCKSNDAGLINYFTQEVFAFSKHKSLLDLNELHEAILKTSNKFYIVEFEVRIMNRKPTFFEKFWHDGFKDYPQF